MAHYYDAATRWVSSVLNACWQWFDSLSRPEWLVVLIVVTSLGFLCMRGYGSRTGY